MVHGWHRANPPDVRQRSDAWFDGWSLAQLPRALDPLLTRAEAALPDDRTWEAVAVAWSLQRWGATVDQVGDAYEAVAWGHALEPDVAWLRWLVRLHRDGFEREGWDALGVVHRGGPESLIPFLPKEESG